MEKLTNETYGTSRQPTSPGSPRSTYAPASESGPMRSAQPDGPMTGLSGQEVSRANLSARQAREKGLLTSGIYGQQASTSSSSAAPTSCLESRYRARTVSLGSTLYRVIWKVRVTPLGRSIPAQRASVLRTSGKGSTGQRNGWPTPRAEDAESSGIRHSRGVFDTLTAASSLAGWLTPSANEDAAGNPGAKMQAMLGSQVKLAGWPTPMAGTPAQNGNNEAGNNDSSRKTVTMAGWPTPTVGNAMGSQSFEGLSPTGKTPDGRKVAVSLNHLATMLEFENQDGTFRMGPERKENMGHAIWPHQPARLTASGEMLTGSSAGMESGGQLNPAHSRWLMGLPPEWDDCGVTAMQSMQRQPRRGSKAISTPAPSKPARKPRFNFGKLV